MIASFRDKEAERIWEGRRSRRLPGDIQAAALRKLRVLNAARSLADLRVPPANRSKRCAAIAVGSTRSASMTNGGSVLSGERAMPTRSKSSTTTDLIPNPHPGEILMEEFLKPMALSQTALAKAIKVPPRRINEIVLGKRAITADTDLRLARYFGMSEGFFLRLQTDYELMARRREIADQLKTIRPRAA
jgi:addiction module HigA family antidote